MESHLSHFWGQGGAGNQTRTSLAQTPAKCMLCSSEIPSPFPSMPKRERIQTDEILQLDRILELPELSELQTWVQLPGLI